MSFLDSLFGSSAKTTTQTLPTLTPEQQAGLKQLLDKLTGAVGSSSGGATSYSGSFAAPLSTLQQTSLTGLQNYATSLVDPSAQGLNRTAQDTLQKTMTDTPASTEKYFDTNVRDPALRDFTENILPAITKRFGGSGAFGSDRMNMEARTTRDFGTGLEANRAKVSFDQLNAQKDRSLKAASLAPAAGMAPIQQLLASLSGGAVDQQTRQLQLTGQYSEFQRQQQQQQQFIDDLLKSLGIKGQENIVTVQPGSAGILGGMAGGLGQGLGQTAFGSGTGGGGSSGWLGSLFGGSSAMEAVDMMFM
jgi:hypothetical protein